jgi:hypothetical protein
MISAAGAIAAVIALLILTPRLRVRHPVVPPQEGLVSAPTTISAAKQLPSTARRVEKAHRALAAAAPIQLRHSSDRPTREQGAYAYVPPYEPVIEISIPAEEMFPPGAVPAGMGFAVDVAIGPDGSADGLRLRPRLAGFERRTLIP